jgi:hypothetical protein
MTVIDPDRPGIEAAAPPYPRHIPASDFDGQRRINDGWTVNRPRSNGLMLTGGIVVALMMAGWVTFSGMFETDRTTNTPPMSTSQATKIPVVSSSTPATTDKAPAR